MAPDTESETRPPWADAYPADVDWNAEFPVRPLYALVDEAVERFGDRPCLDFLGRRYRYDQVGTLIDRAARGFQELGVGKGVNVGLLLPNTPYYVICFFAVLKAGGTVVNYNPLYVEEEIRRQVEDSETDIMVTLDLAALHDKVAAVMGGSRLRRIVVCPMAEILPFPKNLLFRLLRRREVAAIPRDEAHVPFGALVANDGRPREVAIEPKTDIAVIQYTGGTTGVPKGACLTHYNLYANTIQIVLWFHELEPGGERIVALLPFFHVFGMSAVMNFGLHIGAELILLPRFELDALLRVIDRRRPTSFPGVPTVFNAINGAPDLDRHDLSCLKACISGGASLPLQVKKDFEAGTGSPLVEGYGLTEASPVVACNPVDGEGKPGSVGLPVPGTTIEIVSLEDGRTPVPAGEKGEICIRGPQVMAGYWKRPEETAEALRDGRLHTGDIGYMDEDGYTFIVDRQKEVIIAGGYNIYPRIVEEALHRHPKIREAAVIGVPDAYRGETVKAYIVPVAGETLDEAEIEAFLEDKLAPMERPKQMEFRKELPKSMVGKILKRVLLEEHLAAAGPAADRDPDSNQNTGESPENG